jgi:hypothetical protein
MLPRCASCDRRRGPNRRTDDMGCDQVALLPLARMAVTRSERAVDQGASRPGSPGGRAMARCRLSGCALLLVVAALLPATAAGDCVDYGEYMHWVAQVSLPVYASTCGVAQAGDLAIFVAVDHYTWDGWLFVVDVSDPGDPALIGSLSTWAAHVALAAGYAYVIEHGRFRLSCGWIGSHQDRGRDLRGGSRWRCGSARGCGSRTPSA